MFKIVTRAKANPAKREPFAIRTLAKTARRYALYHGARISDNIFLFFYIIENNTFCVSNQECVDRPVGENRAKKNLQAMKVASSIPWPPWLMWMDVPASISHGVTCLTVLVALTLIFVGMMSSNGRVNVPNSTPSSISVSGRQYLDELSRRAN